MITLALWDLQFYPGVYEDVESMSDALRGKFEAYFSDMETNGGNLGMPATRPLGDGLFELRVKADKDIARALFCYQKGRQIIFLRSFVKKQQKTPQREIDLARKRMQELSDG